MCKWIKCTVYPSATPWETQGQDKHLAAWRPTCCHQYTTLGIHNPFTQRLTGETCKLNKQREKQRTLDNRNNHFRSICTIFLKKALLNSCFFSLVRIGTRWKSNWRGGAEEARSRCSKAGWVYIPGLLWIGSSEARWRWRKECRQDGDGMSCYRVKEDGSIDKNTWGIEDILDKKDAEDEATRH